MVLRRCRLTSGRSTHIAPSERSWSRGFAASCTRRLPTSIATETVQAAVERVCARFSCSYWREHDHQQRYPADFHAALAEEGWLGIALPEELGGSGLGISEATAMMQTITESGAGMVGAQAIHANVYATQPLARFGSHRQRTQDIPGIVSGRWRACFGVTEPNTGLDTLNLATRADKMPDGAYRISGQKTWITCAHVASKMILLARTAPRQQGSRSLCGLSLFCIDLDHNQPGLMIRPISKMGSRAVAANDVFENYRVPAETLVGTEGKGFGIVLRGMNAERCLLAGEALGLGYAALSRAVQYARERVFRRPIGMNQGVAHPLADVYLRLEAAKLATYHAARLYDSQLGKDASITQEAVGVAANGAKYLAAEASFTACERALLTHGGMGYATDYDVERWSRENLIPCIAPVSKEMILNFISEKVLKLPRSY